MKFINQLKRFAELLEDINSTTSTLEKVEILKKKKDDTESMKLLKLAIDPSFTFGLTKAKIRSFDKNVISHTIESEYSLSEILSWLTLRNFTGDNACSLVKTLEMCLSECDDKENLINTLHNIIDKNLGVRIGAKEINKAIPNHIFEFSVALAEKYHDKKNSELVGSGFFISQKLDGLRIIIIKDGKNIEFKSRTGKDILTLDLYKPQILKVFGEHSRIVLDGEVLNSALHSEDSFKNVMTQITKKGHQITDCNLCLFDLLPIAVFKGEEVGDVFVLRYDTLKSFDVSGTQIEIVEQVAYTPAMFEVMKQEMYENGWEGLMFRKNDVYKGKRSKDILKYKEFFDEELVVTRIELTTKMMVVDGSNIEVECMGSVIVDYQGFEVGVGSGWTDEQRIRFAKKPEELIGNLLTIRYKQVLKTDGRLSLQFPVVKCIHGKTREV